MPHNSWGMATTALILAVAACLIAAWCALDTRSSSVVTEARRVQNLEGQLLSVNARLEALEARWVAYQTELGGMLEAIENEVGELERRRKRVRAQETRAAKREAAEQGNGELDPMDRDHIRLRARDLGIPV